MIPVVGGIKNQQSIRRNGSGNYYFTSLKKVD